MLEVFQLVSYLRHYWKRDGYLIKGVVLLCFVIDTICTIAIFAWAYIDGVIHWGQVEYLSRQFWPTPTWVFCTTFVGAIVQSFLIYRYYLLSSQRIMSCILAIFMFGGLVGGFLLGIFNITFVSYADREKPKIISMIWLISSSTADVLIAVSLVLALSRVSAITTIRRTKLLLSKLIIVSIQSGAVTTILALLLLTFYLASPTTNDPAIFGFILGRAYTITMLFNLNIRRSLETTCTVCGMNTLGGAASAATKVGMSNIIHGEVDHPASGLHPQELGLPQLDVNGTIPLEDAHSFGSRSSLRASKAPELV